MTKKQKIWFGVFLAMFLIPEVLWPQSTVIVYSWIREIFFGISPKAGELSKFDLFKFFLNPILSGGLFVIKSIGLFASFIYSWFFYRAQKNIFLLIIAIIFGLLSVATGFYVLFVINFRPQIG